MNYRNRRILVTGANGFLGRFVVDELKRRSYKNLLTPNSQEYDLRIFSDCQKIISQSDIVIHLAANVGGIGYNQNYPADLFYENLLMGLNVLHASMKSGIQKLVALGTVCAYPKYTPLPFNERNLWDGYPDETTAPYGLAKKMLLVGGDAYRKQYGLKTIYLIPVNLYGPKDNFNTKKSHVISALIKKIYAAKINGQSSVTVWGTGKASREFLYVEDAARAIVLAMEKYENSDPVNIGSGEEIFIKDVVGQIVKLVNYQGKIVWDKTKPDGQPRRLLSVDLAYKNFGFRARIPFVLGIEKTLNWYIKNYKNLR